MKKAGLFIVLGVILLGVMGMFAMNMTQRGAKAPTKKDPNVATVERGDLTVRVVESGLIDAVRAVEVRSRASGRLARLLVNEGDFVTQGQLVAVIDPQETELRVRQDVAQLSGARSGVSRTSVEIEQAKITLRQQYEQAKSRVAALRSELKVQPTLTRSAIDQAKAQYDAAVQQYESLKQVTQPNQRVEVEAALENAIANLEQSKREYQRQQEQEAKGYVAGVVVERAKVQVEIDQNRYATAKANHDRLATQQRLELERAQNDVRGAYAAYKRAEAGSVQDETKRRELEQAIAAMEQARANMMQVDILRRTREQGQATVNQLSSVVADSQRQLRETQVRAPFSGVITKRYIEEGDLVTALSTFSAGTPIFRLEDRSVLRVKLEMNEIDVARITNGMAVQVELDALPGKKLSGKVSKIAPTSIAASSTTQQAAGQGDNVVKYSVEVDLDQTLTEIRTGMTAKCTLTVANRPSVLRLPVAFVAKDDKGSFVMLKQVSKDPKNEGKRQDVRVGLSTGAFVEILEGLKEGDEVVKPKYTGPDRQGFMSGGGSNDDGE